MKTENVKKGRQLFNKLHGGHTGEALLNDTKDICPEYANMGFEWVYGEILSRPGLDTKTRILAIIAVSVAGGHMPQLEAYIEAAFNARATKQEIIEMILQTGIFAGFPVVTNSFAVAKAVFARIEA